MAAHHIRPVTRRRSIGRRKRDIDFAERHRQLQFGAAILVIISLIAGAVIGYAANEMTRPDPAPTVIQQQSSCSTDSECESTEPELNAPEQVAS